MEIYLEKAKNAEAEDVFSKAIKIIFTCIVLFVIGCFFAFIAEKFYLNLPQPYYSIFRQKIVEVLDADGKKMPLSPLPKKYKEIIYIE